MATSARSVDDKPQTLRDRYNAFVDRHEVAWELTFAALAVVFVALAFVVVVPGSSEWAAVESLEWLITLVFAAEFFSRLGASYDRRAYFRGHWIDLISVIPPARWLRPFRLLRLLRLIRAFAGVARALGHVQRLATHRGLIWLFAAWLAVMFLSSAALYAAENGVNAAVTSPLDALWWGITTMTTVGYGDVYPVTAEGRVAATVLMVLGIALYSAITATVTSFMLLDRGSTTDIVGRLERLAGLRTDGNLSDAEFEAAKAAVLSPQPSASEDSVGPDPAGSPR
jgi:voltage-gated potassium channel